MGILDGIVEWIAEQVMNILDMINTSVLGALGCDMETFLRYFPAAETFYDVIVALAIGLLLLNLIFQLFRGFGILGSNEAESPISLTVRSLGFMFLAFYANEILDIILKIGGTPYEWFMTDELPPLNFADFNSVLLTILGVSLNGSIALIALILLVILAWNYLKLLFEAAERYVLLGVLVYTAPVAFSMGGSQNTINIFHSWCRMLGGQIFMILMNVWCLRIFTSMFANFISNPLSLEDGNFLIWFLCTVGFLKVSQKTDNFMQTLGVNVGRTGSAMLGEAAIAMKSMGMAGKSSSGGSSSASAGTHTHSGSETVLQGGLVGVVGRQFNQNAVSNITGKSDSLASNIARSVYNSSIQNGGEFSTNVISTVANGDISRTGSIKGTDAVQAFQSYMGMTHTAAKKNVSEKERSVYQGTMGGASEVSIGKNPREAGGTGFSFTSMQNSSTSAEHTMDSMHTSAEQILAEYQQNIGMESQNGTQIPYEIEKNGADTTEKYGNSEKVFGNGSAEIPFIPSGSAFEQGQQAADTQVGWQSGKADFYSYPSADPAAQFSHIEIGGGRITGTETSEALGGSKQFAMYSTEKYLPPAQGDYTTVTAADGSKWYHQYAQPTVIKEPYMKEDGKIQYKEHIENKLPEPPKRKDRI